MIKMEGRLLNFGIIDSCGRMFSEDCKFHYLNEVPITVNFNHIEMVGYGKIIQDDKGLKLIANLVRDDLDELQYAVGGFYTGVKYHEESNIMVIDECNLKSVSLVYAPADKDLIIRKIDEEDV